MKSFYTRKIHPTLATLSICYFQVNIHELKNRLIDEIFPRHLEKLQNLPPRRENDKGCLILARNFYKNEFHITTGERVICYKIVTWQQTRNKSCIIRMKKRKERAQLPLVLQVSLTELS